ncbi:GNAT family N-acetyltransferase [Halofilum ochraceum]|uniref:bifunctional acetate--CoA ligase family protein/GNAT family N-acetyltransferase n=1 Tax=Halofilum ochraceum TaxID=1611323 RepID=UPI0008DAF061|nr:GNAT family N-acetyltransferase [Halofilum ochraceum]
MRQHYLQRLFAPDGVAVFGANDDETSVGGRVLRNLLEAGYSGGLYPVNPHREKVQGLACHARIRDVGVPIDLAIVATPADTVPDVLRDCGEHGVAVAVVMSAGFGEAGASGKRREQRLVEIAQQYELRLVGPNCLGLIRPSTGLNATFSLSAAQQGRLALVSQSGALCTAILDWASPRHLGFSAVVSLGDAADVHFGDVLDYLAQDRDTSSILLYVEGVHWPRRFLSALRSVTRVKPVIVIKAGRRVTGSRAAMSHTGALVGDDDAFNAALSRAGAVRVQTISQLFSAAQILAEYSGDVRERLGVITNAGGPGVLAADRAADLDIELPEPEAAMLERLDAGMPAGWSRANPLDILGDAPPERYGTALEACLAARNLDAVLVILTPQAMSDPEGAAEVVIAARERTRRPVLACWMGGERVEAARRRFYDSCVPHFPSPEAAVEAFACLVQRRRNRELLMQVAEPRAYHGEPDVEGARLIIEGALAEHRRALSEMESKAVLSAFGIPTNASVGAQSAREALVSAESLGFPVAMKIDSPDISHKSDVGGVRLNIPNAQAVSRSYNELVDSVRADCPEARINGVTIERMYREPHARELMIGVARDRAFGPVISFGAGGTAVEIMRDRSVALPPLNSFIAGRMIDDTRVSRMLGEWRHMPAVDRQALEEVLLRISELVCEMPHVVELDINPLMATSAGVQVVDARIVVEAPKVWLEPYGHMAIHPFPAHMQQRFMAPDGTEITIRPIRPEDADIEQAFVRGLSEASRYLRFMASLKELSREALVRFTQIDYDRELALIATTERGGTEVQLGVARYTITPDGEGCEFAIVVTDEIQGTGLGSRLLGVLMEAARDRGLREMIGETLSTNDPMRSLAERLGFSVRTSEDDPTILLMHRRL